MADAIESRLLQELDAQGTVADSGDFAASLGVDHLAVVGVVKSLGSAEMIVAEVNTGRAGRSACGLWAGRR